MAEREQEIRERLAAATPGPWWVEGQGGITMDGKRDGYHVHANAPDGRLFRVGAGNRSSESDAELIANAPADLAYLLEENQRLREAAGRVVDNHEAVLAARPVDGSPLTIAHWNEIERLKVALGRPAEFDVDAAVATLEQIMLVRLGKAEQERDKALADLAAARAEIGGRQQAHELESRAYQSTIDETNALLSAARAEVEEYKAWIGSPEVMAAYPNAVEYADDHARKARAEVERLRKALEKYGGHRRSCSMGNAREAMLAGALEHVVLGEPENWERIRDIARNMLEYRDSVAEAQNRRGICTCEWDDALAALAREDGDVR